MKNSMGVRASYLALGAFFLFGAGCSKTKDPVITGNRVSSDEVSASRAIGDDRIQFQVLGSKSYAAALKTPSVIPATSLHFTSRLALLTQGVATSRTDGGTGSGSVSSDSLILGFPISQLGQQFVFGGVITTVSATDNEDLGGLKLTDLPPLHVRAVLSEADAPKPALILVGCAQECKETSRQQALVSFPILGIDENADTLLLDLTSVGRKLDLMAMLDPDGEYTGLKTESVAATTFDYSQSTFVFDVKSKMVPKKIPSEDLPTEVLLTVRWYLKLASSFNPAFSPRAQTKGVGYFTTVRSAEPKITRFSATDFGSKPIKYYLKNIPSRYQGAFSAAFDEWNDTFRSEVGYDLIRYEFVDEADERGAHLVAGDIRYNIVEWDLVNKAGYGGLGPSIGHQFTGEVMSANTLVQGPTILFLYKGWFKVNEEAEALEARGQIAAADKLRLDYRRNVETEIARRAGRKFSLKLGTKLDFRVTSQEPSLEDPIMARNDFDDLPKGVSYDAYMFGYFRELVEHEVGHNFGLRHNFRGNHGASGRMVEGEISWSVMEYLGRSFRYLDKIGPYDHMAIGYGYVGKKPTRLDQFCTDEDVAVASQPGNSAECSREDATPDSFSYFETRLSQGLDKLVAKGDVAAPTWTLEDMLSPVSAAAKGLAFYASSAQKTAWKWSNFFGKPGRPSDADGVKDYVGARLKAIACDPRLSEELDRKSTEEAKTKVRDNLKAFRELVGKIAEALGVIEAAALDCEAPTTP